MNDLTYWFVVLFVVLVLCFSGWISATGYFYLDKAENVFDQNVGSWLASGPNANPRNLDSNSGVLVLSRIDSNA